MPKVKIYDEENDPIYYGQEESNQLLNLKDEFEEEIPEEFFDDSKEVDSEDIEDDFVSN